MLINIQVGFSGEEKEEAAKLLNYICQNKEIRNAKVNVDPEPKLSSVKTEPKLTVTEKTAEPVKEDPDPQPDVPPEAPAPAKAYTLEEVRAASKKLIEEKGSEVFAELLKQLGAKRLPDVKPQQYTELMEAINAR